MSESQVESSLGGVARGNHDVGAPTRPVDSEDAPKGDGKPRWQMWRREVDLAVEGLRRDLDDIRSAGPYESKADLDLDEDQRRNDRCIRRIDTDLARAEQCVSSDAGKLPRRLWKQTVAVWTGSESEGAWDGLHDAAATLLMIASPSSVRDSAFRLHTRLQESSSLMQADAKRAVTYLDAIDRIARSDGDIVTMADRELLYDVQREVDEEWGTARDRVRIFRNIVTSSIAFLVLVLLIVGFLALASPGAVPLRSGQPNVAGDVFAVEQLGALGGLVSGVAALQRLKGFQRSYGLPLAQALLKIPMGAAAGLLGVLLMQHGLLTTAVRRISDWSTVLAYAALFGFAQLAVTWAIDSHASKLLGDASGKGPAVRVSTDS